jgi:replicative DNA helicase
MFSLETTAELLYERGASMVLETSGQSIENAFLSGNTKHIMEEMSDFEHVSFCDISGLSVKNMRDTIENMPVRPILVVIDYLTLIKANRGMTKYDQTSDVSKELHRFAKETNTAVMCLSQVGRQTGDETSEVTISAGRNSGEIEEDAFFVLGMWRDPDSPIRQRIVKLLKNKRGEAGVSVKMQFKNESPRLYLCDPFERSGFGG